MVWAAATAAHALDVPPLSQRVTDVAAVFSAAQRQALESRLMAYEQRTTQQFAVLTVPSLEGDPIEDFSIRVVEKWKLGKAKEDNGVLLLLVPKDRKVRIEVGYGLEGKITDALSSRIIREILKPAFRQGDYAGGVDTAVTALMQAGSGEAVQALPEQPEPADDTGGGLSPVVVLVLIALFLFAPRWLWPLLWLGGGGGGRRGGGGNNFFSGGGGGFGGGGASGDW